MTSSLRVMENELENRFAFAETPPAQPSQNSLVKLAAQSGQAVQINGPGELTEQAFAGFLEVAPDAVVVADRDGRPSPWWNRPGILRWAGARESICSPLELHAKRLIAILQVIYWLRIKYFSVRHSLSCV